MSYATFMHMQHSRNHLRHPFHMHIFKGVNVIVDINGAIVIILSVMIVIIAIIIIVIVVIIVLVRTTRCISDTMLQHFIQIAITPFQIGIFLSVVVFFL